MNTITFIFNQLKSISIDTELLEACEWDRDIADSMMESLHTSFEKNKSNFKDLKSAESLIREDLLEQIDEKKADILLSVLRLIFKNESESLIDIC